MDEEIKYYGVAEKVAAVLVIIFLMMAMFASGYKLGVESVECDQIEHLPTHEGCIGCEPTKKGCE